ncbi:immunoglobulin A1 protease autotransporter-like [Leguminivora glycinivorella]|uniref:immunoglobulin A1 protease autotransporter-like n=1 Tax=Leguminivora glycinivorella TaxID=1035111 RepID=UPI0020107F74|nr:immunoglobulin A1 protease autotransporter-like [Leguminivora glycinivorella]
MFGTQRMRLQAVSLAILLAIIDQTQGFTLRYEYVRPHDLTAEESRVSEVRHDSKRDIVENEEFQVAPIGVALPLTMTTQTIPETTFTNEIVTTNVKPEKNETANTNEQEAKKVEHAELSKDTTTLPQTETTVVITEVPVITETSVNKNNESKNINDIPTTVIATSQDDTISEPPNTVATTIEPEIIATTTPSWKKYTKIERKNVDVNENVVPLRAERVGDSINAHTTETRVSLENAFNLAPDILSLQELKSHLLDATNSVPTEINPTEIVSKRAGYLDHTKPELEPAISTVNASKAAYEADTESVAYEMDTHDDSYFTTNKTSHSQMAEDALKEELLVEAHLDDKTFFTPTPESKFYIEQNEITPSSQIPPTGGGDQQPSDDSLTVRPINSDKKSNLYTVSPNYKPLKKIEVQPSKPFVRDPDDNSWRNESLSSLGIVFKGKNSTKAFTEVIKNKTEIVMNNTNTTEPEKVLTKVDLRDRLEKIAEKRKRKKKIDKFGNTEYGDYEENTSGDTHSKETTETPLTTPPTPPELINAGITFGSKMEEFTEKYVSKKPKFTLDYYDGKDDDVDYATYPNIDILKSTPRPRVQWPVTQRILDNTHNVKTYLPDRQPTVQYFPPRTKTPNVHKFPAFRHTVQQENEPFETYTKLTPSKYVTADKIQHVEYRPVGTEGFMIRHYKDLLESVSKDIEYDKSSPYQTPMSDEGKSVKSEEYDYGQRKEGINKYVDYFNQNHERFKADFPVVFNTSIVHGAERGKVLASSTAMFKRLYNGAPTKETFIFSNKPFDPNCENVTVELSPAYELHYYVPDQEETATDHTLPYGYRN